ncbi:MAG: thioesterase domain-containing protein, partial [Sneathiella sp.]
LVSQIENTTGRRISLIDLFQGRTIEDITSGPEWTSDELPRAVSPIRAQGTLTPFFAIGSHPGYLEMSKRINIEQPVYRLDVYALQSKRLSQSLSAYKNIEQITAEFADHIQSLQPQGPYIIGGGCEGALTAFSIATELQQRGEEIAELILWITPAPNYGGGAVFGRSAPFRVVGQLKSLFRRARISDMNFRMIMELIKHEYIEHKIFRSMDNFQPLRKFKGEIILARTVENRHSWDTDLAMGWSEHATAGVKVYELEGNHETWLVNYAQEFGDLLESRLKRVRTTQTVVKTEERPSIP